MSRALIQTALAVMVFLAGFTYAATTPAKQKPIETRVNELLAKMTLEEKVGQLNQISSGMLTGTPVKGNPANDNIEQGLVNPKVK